MSLADTLRDWRDFYAVISAAAATILGAMFVAASIGGGSLDRKHATEINLYVTPVVAHLSAVLFAGALTVMPGLTDGILAALLAAGSLAGLAYSAVRWTHITLRVGDSVETGDRVWYALVPVVAYLGIAGSAAFLAQGMSAGLYLLAASLALLLIACLRNAWDLILFFVANSRR
jgi:hypothetical protein